MNIFFRNKTILIFLLLLLINNTSHSATIKHKYYFSDPIITKQKDNTDIVNFSNCYLTGKIGEPTIPYKSISLLIPQGHITKQIKLSYKNKKTINRKISLPPQQLPRTQSASQSTKYIKKDDLYSSNQIYKSLAPEINTHFLNGRPIALACFSPIEYIPVEQNLSYYSEVEVTVETIPSVESEKAQQNYQTSEKINNRLSKIVDNFSQNLGNTTDYFGDDGYDYLIITINDFVKNYSVLAEFHKNRGVKTKIVTVEEIYSSMSGADQPEQIRNYIIDQYQRFGIFYVLLAGDSDIHKMGEQHVPHRGFYCEVQSDQLYWDSTIPSDIYYAALDGNWNNNGDEKWGEPGEADLLPELAVGRICAADSAGIAATLNKIIKYQSLPIIEDATKILMVGEKLWDDPDPLTYGSDYLDLLIGNRTDNGYATIGMPNHLDFIYLYDRTLGTWSKSDLIQLINNGCNMIHHAGHSSTQSNMTLRNSDITNNNFINTNGTEHLNPVIYSQGCLPAAFDRDCIAEMMLGIENFASAYIGNSRYGFSNEGQTEGPTVHQQREFLTAVYGDGILEIGAAHTMSKIRTAPFLTAADQFEPGALRWCFYCCNVLGDPHQALWTDEINTMQNVVIDENTPGEISIQTEVSYATVALTNQEKILACDQTDESGNVTLNYETDDPLLKIVITAQNYIPHQANITVEPTDITLQNNENKISFELKSIYPNPFNLETKIHYSISQISQINLDIFNIMGQKIRTLCDKTQNAGQHYLIWDGLDNQGHIASSGLYFVRLYSSEGTQIKSCILLK